MSIVRRVGSFAFAAALLGAAASVFAYESAYPLESGAAVSEDGMLIVPPGAIQPADPLTAPYASQPDRVVVDQQLFANGLVVPAGYRCPSEGHCETPCIACRQAQFAGWAAAFDLLLYRPIWAGGDATIVHSNESSDGGVGPRFTLRHEAYDGNGIEMRIGGIAFSDLKFIDSSATPTLVDGEIEMFQFDFDLTQRFWIGDSSLVFGVGPRAASLMYRIGPTPELQVNTGGAGVSALLDRPIWRSSKTTFAAIGYGRASLMGGNVENAAGATVADGTMSILEAGFGLEMRRQWGRGDFLGRVTFDSQWWEPNIMAPIYVDGVGLRVGYQW